MGIWKQVGECGLIAVMVFLLWGGVEAAYAQSLNQGVEGSQGILEISFEYRRRGGIASNQFALWIEDAKGNLVKTLYVTRFTGYGGYLRRPDCLPTWVEKAKPAELPAEVLDTISTPTPPGGLLVYSWDGRDERGNLVEPGEYRFFLEATLYWSNRVLYSGRFHYGGDDQETIPISVTYFGEEKYAGMIQGVKVRYISQK
jgi:hypothetical protein